MAGEIYLKERAIITLTASGASLSSGSAGVANGTADLDMRSSGNAPEDMQGIFQLTAQWATVTGITQGTYLADLALIPMIDATNVPQIDTTATTSFIPFPYRVASFIAGKAVTANTDAFFATGIVDLMPVLYRVYILNRSGQTITANWSLKVVTARMQYS